MMPFGKSPFWTKAPILITLSGIVMLVILLQSLNTKDSIMVTPSGIMTLARLLHQPGSAATSKPPAPM